MDVAPSPSYIEPPPLAQKSNFPMLYYGLVIIGTAVIVLLAYNLIVIKWCANRRRHEGSGQRPTRVIESAGGGQRLDLSTFKYRKDDNMGNQGQGSDSECAVCLSVFEEDEEIRQLPGCNHSFHAPCIDMWLYSHSDCPLCRARVVVPYSWCRRHSAAAMQENSQENLLGPNVHFIPIV